jgi:hypothetical protein
MMMSSVDGKKFLINLALTDFPSNRFSGFSFIPNPVSMPEKRNVNASEVFHAGGIMPFLYKSGVPYRYPRSKINAASNPVIDKKMKIFLKVVLDETNSKEVEPSRNNTQVIGDMRPIGKLYGDSDEFPRICSILIGYPLSASINMIRETAKTNKKMALRNLGLIRFCFRLSAEKLRRTKQIMVTGAIGIEFLPIPASDNSFTNHPDRAITPMPITIQNETTEIFS